MVDFNLLPESEAVDAGRKETGIVTQHPTEGTAPDLGALEVNQKWDLPMPGPRWAVGKMKPWRPPLPASLSPHWIGLQEDAKLPEHTSVFPLGKGLRSVPMSLHYRADQVVPSKQVHWKVIQQGGADSKSPCLQAVTDEPFKKITSKTPPDFTVKFELDQPQSLRFWFKVKAKSGGCNSFWIRPRGMKDVQGNWMIVEANPGDWTWVSWQGNGATFGPGPVQVDFHVREVGLLLDDILITNEWDGLPSGPWKPGSLAKRGTKNK